MITLTESINNRLMNSILNKDKVKKNSALTYDWYEGSGLYNKDQLFEIEAAYTSKIDIDKIMLIANPEFMAEQMYALRLGAEAELSMEQLEVLARPELTWLEIKAGIRLCRAGIDLKHLSLYMQNEYKGKRGAIGNAYKAGINQKSIDFAVHKRFDPDQTYHIIQGFIKGISLSEMKKLAKPTIKYPILAGIIDKYNIK